MLPDGVQIRVVHGLDLDRALHDAPGPVLVVVTRPGCGACAAVKAALAGVSAPPGLAAWEVDATTAPALVDELDIFHLPALWLFLDGEPSAPLDAPPVPARLDAAIHAALRASRSPSR